MIKRQHRRRVNLIEWSNVHVVNDTPKQYTGVHAALGGGLNVAVVHIYGTKYECRLYTDAGEFMHREYLAADGWEQAKQKALKYLCRHYTSVHGTAKLVLDILGSYGIRANEEESE